MEIVNVKNAPMKNKATYLIISLFLVCASLQLQAQRTDKKGDQKENDKDSKSNKKKSEDPTLLEKSNESAYEKELGALLLTEEAKKSARKNHTFFERLFSSDDEMLKQERINALVRILEANQSEMKRLNDQLSASNNELNSEKNRLKIERELQEYRSGMDKITVEFGDIRWAKENLDVNTLVTGEPIIEIEADDNAGWLQAFKNKEAAFVILNVDGEEAKAYNYWAIVSGKLAPKGWRLPTLIDAQNLQTSLEAKFGKGLGAEHLRRESAMWGKVKGKKMSFDSFDFGLLPFGYYSSRGWMKDESILRLALEDLEGMVYFSGDSNEIRVQEIDTDFRESSLGWVVRCVLETK
jgi:uncharacterized protein (TIGR02145 family)